MALAGEERKDYMAELRIEKFIESLGEDHPLLHWCAETKRQIKRDYDSIELICGPEGCGKSTECVIKRKIVKPRENPLDGIVFYDWTEFIYKFRSGRRGEVIHLDEAVALLFNRKSMHAVSKILVEELIEGREYGKIVLLCIPRARSVDEYLHDFRALYRTWTPRKRGEMLVRESNVTEFKTYWNPKYYFQFPPLPEKVRLRYKEKKRRKKMEYDLKRIKEAKGKKTKEAQAWQEYEKTLERLEEDGWI